MAEFEYLLLKWYQDYGTTWNPAPDLRRGAGTERDNAPFFDESSEKNFVSTKPKGILFCDDSDEKTMAHYSEGSYPPNVHGAGGE